MASSYYSLTPEQKKARIASALTPQAQQAHYNNAMSTPKPSQPVSAQSAGGSTPSTPRPSTGYKTHYLESGGRVTVNDQGKITQYGGTNSNGMSIDDFNAGLANEYNAGKIKNSFDFINGKGTQYNTGTTDWSPFAVDLQTAHANGASGGMSAQTAKGGTGFNTGINGTRTSPDIAPLNTSMQKYFPQTGSVPQQTASPQTATPSNDYAAQAAARTAAALAQKQTIAEQQKSSADTAFEKQNLRTNDNRVLQDFSRSQTVNPFSGRTSYENGLIGRERTQADADASAALATQKGNIDQLLADYQNATAEEQVRIADELERADRQYKLQLDAFNRGNFENDRNFGYQAGRDQVGDQRYNNEFQYRQGRDQANDQQQQQQQRSAEEQQAWENRFNYGQATGTFNNGQQTIQKAQQEWDNAFTQGQFDFQKAQQIYENAFKERSFQQDMEEAAKSRGLQWASLGQRDKEFLADQEFKEKQFRWNKDMDIAQTWQKTREMDLAEKKLNTTEKATYNEAMQKAIDLALKDTGYASAKTEADKNSIIDSYYNKLTADIGMADEEIKQFLK